jgi:hypothetical protein
VSSTANDRREQKVHKFRLPSPALVIALVALVVALSGTAVAAGVVPLARRALQADNARHAMAADKARVASSSLSARHADVAKKLGTAAADALAQQAAQLPGPASSAAGIVTIKSTPAGQLAPNTGQPFTISCDPGQKILAAGFASDNAVINIVESHPTGDASWTLGLANLNDTTAANVTLYATCIK